MPTLKKKVIKSYILIKQHKYVFSHPIIISLTIQIVKTKRMMIARWIEL